MEGEQLETWKTALIGETLLFGLLGKLLYEVPDRGWLGTLVRDEVFAEAPFGKGQAEIEQGLKTLRQWAERNRSGTSEKEFEAIQSDHLYLFTGVGQPLAPVWESIYFSEARLLFQHETFQVRDWYARFGLQAERKGNEPDDHLGLELSFLAHLAALGLQALEIGDQGAFEPALRAQSEFLSEHPLRWAPAWAKLVQQHAKTDFYRGLAHLVMGSLLAAAELLEIEIPKKSLA